MSDPRLLASNGRVADAALQGQVEAAAFVAGETLGVTRPVLDLTDAAGRRQRQVLLGQDVTRFEDRAGHSFVRAANGYVGYVASDALGPPIGVTHFVATFGTHAYDAPDIKAPEREALPFGCRVVVGEERQTFCETDRGFVPKRHLRPMDRPFADPATVAQMHFGVPYLWGGNSTRGIDCSGLVSAALEGCGIACPGDSDMQRALGEDLAPDTPLRRGDLVFWRGHVGMMVDGETLLHANAHHMAVAYEPFAAAKARIAAKEFGEIVAVRRLPG